MYERNAVVLERYFDEMFGYNLKNNIKTNFDDYCQLIDSLEKYQNISEEEETVIQEYDSIANRIREIQKLQENLNKRNAKLQEEREAILQNIGDNASTIQKKLDNVNNSIQSLNDEIKENAQKFVDVVSEFNEKSVVRTDCGKSRRSIENEYNRKLNQTLDNYQDIDIEIERKAKQFIEIETDQIETEIKEKMKKNGEKEKIPFNSDVLSKAIALSIDIQKRETDILANVYDKTNRLFTEIKGGSVRVSKHKKIIKDAKCKLEFLSAIKEYLIQFLDNERLTAVNGNEEHNKLMLEACKNLDEDLMQINNLYTLLLREASKKITKKSYPDLYNFNYILALENKAEQFDDEIKKLNLPVTIINPNHWRIEGMQKIYDVFYRCVTEEYDRDLSEYMPKEEKELEDENFEDDFENFDSNFEQPTNEENDANVSEENVEDTKKISKDNAVTDAKAEIDRKIDMILGLDIGSREVNTWDDDDEDEDESFDDDEDDEELESKDNTEDNQEDDDYGWDDEDIFGNEENDDKEDLEQSDNDDVDFDIWGNKISKEDKSLDTQDDEETDDDEESIFDDDDDSIFDDDDSIFGDDDETSENEEDDDDFDDDNFKADKKKKGKHVKKNTKKENTFNSKGKKSILKEQEDIDEKQEDNDNWGDEFVKIDKKENAKKKKGFFDKFKR